MSATAPRTEFDPSLDGFLPADSPAESGSAGFADAAPMLYRLGLNVVPIIPGTKKPPCHYARWQCERQTTAEVDRLRRKFADCDLAIILGTPGLPLVDVEADSRSGERRLRDARLPVPPTTCFSSRRGTHRLFESPGRLPRKAGNGSPHRGVDFLGSGICLVPPSAGRNWILGFDHLQRLPRKLQEAFERPARRRRLAHLHTRKATTASPTHVQDLLHRHLGDVDRGVWQAAARLLGLPEETGRAFLCPLPGHEESSPSAEWWTDDDGEIVLVDFHRRGCAEPGCADAAPCYTLIEVYAAVRSHRTRKLRPPEHATWARRLLVELGLASPAPVLLLPLPASASSTLRRVYEGVRLLFGCRWLGTYGAPAPLSWRFLGAWCGLNERTAGAALNQLLRFDVLRPSGRYRRMTLFLPAAPEEP